MAAGKVKINKLTKGFPYLVTNGFLPPPKAEPPDVAVMSSPVQLQATSNSKRIAQRWDKRLACRRDRKEKTKADNEMIQQAIRQAMIDSGATSHFVQSKAGLKQTGTPNTVVSTANGAQMQGTCTVELPLQQLNQSAKQATVVP